MSRLDKDRQTKLEPERMQFAIEEIESLGYEILYKDNTKIQFFFKHSVITFFPYSGWASGKNIKDGRGIGNLLIQINKKAAK
jgi:hypothetical protein